MPGTVRSLQQMYPKRVDVLLLILVSAVLFVVGLNLPILTVQKLWEKNTFSIMSGIVNLWNEGNPFLAVVITIFSVVFPAVKLLSLLAIWFVKMADARRKWILYALEGLGRWSMLDVFIVAILIVAVKLGALASAQAEKGVYCFGAAILLAMVATTIAARLGKHSV